MNKNIIKQVLLEQKTEINTILQEKIIVRDKENVVKSAMSNRLIKVIIGVRRSGKSMLAHKILTNKVYAYINFDDERFIGAKTGDLNDFLEVLKEIEPQAKTLLLDEAQNISGWELFANRLKRFGYNIIITGSNARLLSRELATHLTGRHVTIELYPFSFKEFILQCGYQFQADDFFITEKKAALKKYLEKYLEQGGFPELFQIENKNQYLRDLYDKIISRDITPRHNVKYVKDLKEIALYLFSNFGSRYTYQKLSRAFGIKSVHTIKNYISYLEEAYLLFELMPFSFKAKQQINAPKKIYAIDTGMINAIALQNSANFGRLMENAVFLELKRRGHEIYYYSDALGRETDFVIKQGRKILQLIQVCKEMENLETREREIKSILQASENLKCSELLIITALEEDELIIGKNKIKLIPLWKWLLSEPLIDAFTALHKNI
ncbi:MAG: hypothetical protein US83_C0008G0049 [Candidatus Falkowbacteria bacterium GW2011_GWC2_38_22]|uniref:ATPase n=1 Tax=Candidatus Falkowbacteria bacterium GW2011_GWE1_38_31 TaxID=1618638 RepID=A0A0G0JR07_9BACT|nr:MAG: hypothetical protein US73_C0006G0046 [Candidatus Falkowbacteria bacterium GW2011_GWF2_38_1205]KKQ61208.1 MAG: hypothetical protein US83_C0008G0049 [Candidatus Falkowbacteria bacterium GW2011_GWC2_38_22]KKQ63286.1 MAG: hypothetical protein US84_C0007G0028 [Candidatus Falkowbacteria bacterium GW2011_GWF1_38_22]KKQ65596.1 MAG: hypothetical protein US87_C0006G0046 [Candidatus Falkowbacteria bacterium GW2011_GWE2_38_254]KKQ70018.1 MAG: hypothetical protein US91_C0007G0028 [Candidatus Falkowb